MRASRRSSVANSRFCRAHNSAIAATYRPKSTRLPPPWHCYSAVGAPRDVKAITRLVPRHDNRRDRDVAKPVASAKAHLRGKQSCGGAIRVRAPGQSLGRRIAWHSGGCVLPSEPERAALPQIAAGRRQEDHLARGGGPFS